MAKTLILPSGRKTKFRKGDMIGVKQCCVSQRSYYIIILRRSGGKVIQLRWGDGTVISSSQIETFGASISDCFLMLERVVYLVEALTGLSSTEIKKDSPHYLKAFRFK